MFCMDYMFMTQRPSEEQLTYPILVIKERVTDGIWALPVTRKGTQKNNVVKQVLEIINSVGSPKVILKSDQEPAIIDLQKEIRKELWDEVLKLIEKIEEDDDVQNVYTNAEYEQNLS